jgi:hypothetical protein
VLYLCFLVPPPLPVQLFALALPHRLVVVGNALLGMVNIDLLLLLRLLLCCVPASSKVLDMP